MKLNHKNLSLRHLGSQSITLCDQLFDEKIVTDRSNPNHHRDYCVVDLPEGLIFKEVTEDFFLGRIVRFTEQVKEKLVSVVTAKRWQRLSGETLEAIKELNEEMSDTVRKHYKKLGPVKSKRNLDVLLILLSKNYRNFEQKKNALGIARNIIIWSDCFWALEKQSWLTLNFPDNQPNESETEITQASAAPEERVEATQESATVTVTEHSALSVEDKPLPEATSQDIIEIIERSRELIGMLSLAEFSDDKEEKIEAQYAEIVAEIKIIREAALTFLDSKSIQSEVLTSTMEGLLLDIEILKEKLVQMDAQLEVTMNDYQYFLDNLLEEYDQLKAGVEYVKNYIRFKHVKNLLQEDALKQAEEELDQKTRECESTFRNFEELVLNADELKAEVTALEKIAGRMQNIKPILDARERAVWHTDRWHDQALVLVKKNKQDEIAEVQPSFVTDDLSTTPTTTVDSKQPHPELAPVQFEEGESTIEQQMDALLKQLLSTNRWADVDSLLCFVPHLISRELRNDIFGEAYKNGRNVKEHFPEDKKIGAGKDKADWSSREAVLSHVRVRVALAWPLLGEMLNNGKITLVRKILKQYSTKHWKYSRINVESILKHNNGFQSLEEVIEAI